MAVITVKNACTKGEAKGSKTKAVSRGGKYVFSWESDGTPHKATLTAKDDREALRKFIQKNGELGPLFNYQNIMPDEADIEALKKAGAKDGDWFKDIASVLSFMEDGNGDGCDWVNYIARPDGSYLFEADGEAEDWD